MPNNHMHHKPEQSACLDWPLCATQTCLWALRMARLRSFCLCAASSARLRLAHHPGTMSRWTDLACLLTGHVRLAGQCRLASGDQAQKCMPGGSSGHSKHSLKDCKKSSGSMNERSVAGRWASSDLLLDGPKSQISYARPAAQQLLTRGRLSRASARFVNRTQEAAHRLRVRLTSSFSSSNSSSSSAPGELPGCPCPLSSSSAPQRLCFRHMCDSWHSPVLEQKCTCHSHSTCLLLHASTYPATLQCLGWLHMISSLSRLKRL